MGTKGQDLQLKRAADSPASISRIIVDELASPSPDMRRVKMAFVLSVEAEIERAASGGDGRFTGARELAQARQQQWEILSAPLPDTANGSGWDELLDVSPPLPRQDVQARIEAAVVVTAAGAQRAEPPKLTKGPDAAVLEEARLLVLDGLSSKEIVERTGLKLRTIEAIRARLAG